MNKFWIYVKSILIPVITGGIIGIIISNFIDYSSLQKPFLAPPSTLFPIVWTILYILMGVSYGILKSKKLTSSEIDIIYYIQLIVNALWSIFFFVLKWRLFSIIWIIFLIALVITMIVKFYNKNKTAGIIQIPYLFKLVFDSLTKKPVIIVIRRRSCISVTDHYGSCWPSVR